MYLNRNSHTLSGAIFRSALINIGSVLLQAVFRLVVNRGVRLTPDMTEEVLWNSQIVISCGQILLTGVVFFLALRSQIGALRVIEEEDQMEMALLQKQVFGEELSALTGDSVKRLLQLWTVILVGVRLVYDISSIFYRKFIGNLSLLLLAGGLREGEAFVTLYNSTHGFKYYGMFIALLLGTMMTGIFLDDRILKAASAVLTGLFLLFFGVIQMHTVTFLGRSVGIVWTSVIFHLTESAGLAALAVYLRQRYLGV